jgi:hypothetical protein
VETTQGSDANPAEETTHGYIRAKDKELLEKRLKRIERGRCGACRGWSTRRPTA